MGFWNALSVLAPVAPALSDAQDIRTDRAQSAAKFASDQALKDAQLTAQKLAAQGEQQRLAQGAQPTIIGEPQWDPTTHTNRVLTFDKNTGALALKDAPGTDPSVVSEARYQAAKTDYKKVSGRELTPDEDQSLFFQSYGLKPTASHITQMTGDAGKPYKGNDGQYYVNGKDASGNTVPMAMGPNYNPPTPKPGSPASIYTNLLAKKILADKKQGPPLTNEEAASLTASRSALDEAGVSRSEAWARAAAANHLQAVTDPDTGMDTLIPVAAGVAAFNQGQPYLAGVVSAPTGMDKKNQMLAQSALTQIDSMERVLAKDPNLTGPGSGQMTKFQTWVGSGSEDAQQFLAAATFMAEHGVGVFGGRNIHSIEDLQNLMGNLKTNPAALKAALEQARVTMTPWANAGGRLPGPKAAAPANSVDGGATKQHSLRTAMALPFNKGKTAAQVKADLESHGYTVTP
jgi:hypothetical protein